jgi:hypothetical protein
MQELGLIEWAGPGLNGRTAENTWIKWPETAENGLGLNFRELMLKCREWQELGLNAENWTWIKFLD